MYLIYGKNSIKINRRGFVMKSVKRPTSIIVFFIIMLITPVFTIIANAYINILPLWGENSIFSRMAVTDIVVLLIYPVAAVSIYTVRKAGWWIFIASAAGVFAYNITAYIRNPMISVVGVLFFNLLLFVAAGFFFRKHTIAPYFNPRLRWWEQASRYDIDLSVALEYSDSYELGYLEDISMGGCFIRISEQVKVGNVYPLKLSLGKEMVLSIKGRIMRSVEDDCSLPGYGVMFSSLTDTEREGLENMMKGLNRLGIGEKAGDNMGAEQRAFDRFSVNISVSFRYKGEILPARLINFSSTGACLETMMDMEMGEFCGFYCTLGYSSADVDGVIKWKKKLEHHKQYGIAFINESRKQKSDISQILHTIKALGGKERHRDVKEYEKLVEKTLPSTPYRMFMKSNRDQ